VGRAIRRGGLCVLGMLTGPHWWATGITHSEKSYGDSALCALSMAGGREGT
jgi:hypothetical protein